MRGYRKPGKHIRSRPPGAIVIGDCSILSTPILTYPSSRLQKLAKRRRKRGTSAENKLNQILNEVNQGVLKGKYQREWAFGGKWILDFFFYENRLGIELDGSYHQSHSQRMKDAQKEKACDDFDITLLRLTNREIFGDRINLLNKLRECWRTANQRLKNRPLRKTL